MGNLVTQQRVVKAILPLNLIFPTFLFLLPGLMLLRLLSISRQNLSFGAYFAFALGLSVALPPLLLLLFAQFNWPWNRLTTQIYLLISGIIVLAPTNIPQALRAKSFSTLQWFWQKERLALTFPEISLFFLSLSTLLLRLLIVSDLPTGLFGDSYHHTMISQLLVDHQGLFQSWQPYAPLKTFTYHFGFHANVAFFHWLTGLNVEQSVLLVGQIINAFTVPLVFLCVISLGGTQWTGVWAALITGFLLNLPAFFVNWGRYTQLTGEITLVVMLVCWLELTETSFQTSTSLAQSWRPILLTALTTTAMFLTHYLVTIIALLFVFSYLLTFICVKRSPKKLQKIALQSSIVGSISLLFSLPWLNNLTKGYLLRNASGLTSEWKGAKVLIAQATTLPNSIPLYAKSYLLIAAFVGLGLAGWQRQWRIALCACWTGILILCVIPQVVGLPGTGIIDHLTAFGLFSLTLAPLAGYCFATIQTALFAYLKRKSFSSIFEAAFVSIILCLIVVWSSTWQLKIIDGTTQLVTKADLQAMAWIQNNTKTDSRFLVNSFPAFGGTLIAGTDAGWWLPLLARRATNLPPITYGSELAENTTYALEINRFAEQLRQKPLTDSTPVVLDLTTSTALAILHEAKINYIYSGSHSAPDSNSADHIDPKLLRQSNAFRLVYDQAGTEIFELLPAKN